MVPEAKPVGGSRVPQVTIDRLSIRITQNPLHMSCLVVMANQVLSKYKGEGFLCYGNWYNRFLKTVDRSRSNYI